MEELYHFNKNHDPATGQFTSGAGGVSTHKTRKIQRKLNRAERARTGNELTSKLNEHKANQAHELSKIVTKGKGYVSVYEDRHRRASEAQKKVSAEQKAKVDKLIQKAESAGMTVSSRDAVLGLGNTTNARAYGVNESRYKVRTDDKYKKAKKVAKTVAANAIIG